MLLKWDTAWRALRDAAGLHGLRFYDLRHTIIMELAEVGVADHVLESISGHLSRRMLEPDLETFVRASAVDARTESSSERQTGTEELRP
ncbi:MAG: hypothetical protein IT180_08520 [Acidobacteria bacterium]|nr:hypothetical protein [Acidobacteriota bacterium]